MKRFRHFLLFSIAFTFFTFNADYVHSIVGTQFFMLYGWFGLELSWFIASQINGGDS